VLVADRDPQAALHLASYFCRRGFRTYHTTQGEEAMLLANSRRLLLAVIDVSLLDMSGHALARRLKEIDPELPVLMTSGDYAPELEAAARRVGILYYAHKPADYELIGGVVDKALKN
jgi:DNA-binding NtrC family response regulator